MLGAFRVAGIRSALSAAPRPAITPSYAPRARQARCTQTNVACRAAAPPAERQFEMPPGAPSVDFHVEEANAFCFIGNIGQDPEVLTVPNGSRVANFNVAISMGKDRKPMWMKVVGWNEVAEIVDSFCARGVKVRVVGKIQRTEWVDREGNQREGIRTVASEIALIRRRHNPNKGPPGAGGPPPPGADSAAQPQGQFSDSAAQPQGQFDQTQ